VRSELVAGARPKSCCGWCALTRIVRRRDLRGSLKTLARQIEGQLQADGWNHCAVYEHELIRVWPLDEPEREAKIAKFAKEYGFRLRFYRMGMCAIFDKWPPRQSL